MCIYFQLFCKHLMHILPHFKEFGRNWVELPVPQRREDLLSKTIISPVQETKWSILFLITFAGDVLYIVVFLLTKQNIKDMRNMFTMAEYFTAYQLNPPILFLSLQQIVFLFIFQFFKMLHHLFNPENLIFLLFSTFVIYHLYSLLFRGQTCG